MLKIKSLASFLIGISLLLGLAYYIYNNKQDFDQVKNVSWHQTSYLVLATLLYIASQGLILRAAVSHFGIKLSFLEWFGLMPVAMMSNYIFPAAGVLFCVSYLKRVHGLSYSDYASALSASYISEFFVFALGGVGGLAYLQFYLGVYSPILTIVLGAMSLIFALCLIFTIPFPKTKNKIIHRVGVLLESWDKIRADKSLVYKIISLNVLQFSANSLMFYFAYKAFNWPVPFFANFLIASLSNFSLFIRVAPASLGTYDATILYSTAIYGLKISQGIAVVLLVRLVTVAWLFSLGPIFSFILMRKKGLQ